MATSLDHIYHYYVASVSDRQRRLSQRIGGSNWSFDMATGTLTFGTLKLEVQLLGTESTESNTWLWSWANTQSGIPEHLTSHARSMRDYGQAHGISEFLQPQLSLDEIDGHQLAVTASGLMHANAYYRGPYDGGALYMLIADTQITPSRSNPINRLPQGFAEAVANFPIPRQKDALLGYAQTLGLTAVDQPDGTLLISGDTGSCIARFDEHGRIRGIDTLLS